MKTCVWCGKRFNPEEAEEEFIEGTYLLNYEYIRIPLCGTCAVSAIEDKADGVYFETCERCGKEFDFILEEAEYSNHFPWYNGTTLRDEWKSQVLCAECALEDVDAECTYED